MNATKLSASEMVDVALSVQTAPGIRMSAIAELGSMARQGDKEAETGLSSIANGASEIPLRDAALTKLQWIRRAGRERPRRGR